MKFYLQKYTQNNQDFLIGTMTAKQIIDNSHVLIYNQDEGGYQRAPNLAHINKISKYIAEEDNFILPTAIILGIDNNLLSFKDVGPNFYEVSIDDAEKFRIVDGQHRIEGLKKARANKESIADFTLPVVIILTNPERRAVELEIFSDINSKSKRINTDLAQLAKHDYQVIENAIKDHEITNHIAIKTAFKLKENRDSVWSNAIKFDIQTDFNIGIISVSMFSNSIFKIVDKFKIIKGFSNNGNPHQVIEECNTIADDILMFLNDIWTNSIGKKWESAFKESYQTDANGESVKIFYDTKYYLQKGIGTKSINMFIGDNIDTKALDNSKEKIKK